MTPYFANMDDLLADPLIQSVMRADRVDAAALRVELTHAATRLSARPRPLALSGARVRFGCEPRPAALAIRGASSDDGCEARLCC
jgi:hypothetical protein